MVSCPGTIDTDPALDVKARGLVNDDDHVALDSKLGLDGHDAVDNARVVGCGG